MALKAASGTVGKSRLTVRHVIESDKAAWLEMRRALWPEDVDDDHSVEVTHFLKGDLKNPLAVLVAARSDENGNNPRIVGFAELNIRPYAEGCSTDRVGFLEGWFVVPSARRQGVGSALVAAAEEWARAQGCTEFASDTLVDNDASAAAHQALGFEEVEIIRCFKKDLAKSPKPKA
jgi:aminoglycoside 6'-N-acetyltransferase I